MRFVAPTGWQLVESTAELGNSGKIVAYLANEPLRPDCPRPKSAVCQSPLADELRQGGVFVTWLADPCVAGGCDLPPAPLIRIGNRQGVQAPIGAGCEGTGFTEGSLYHVTVTPQRVDTLVVCARDPSEATRSAFLGFLDAIQWRIP